MANRMEIVCAWREHVLMGIDSERMATERLVEAIDANRSDAVVSCVPKNLRDHLQGTRRLTSGQLQRAHRVLLDNLEALGSISSTNVPWNDLGEV